MPAIESRIFAIVFVGNDLTMECAMVRVAQSDILQAFVFLDKPVSDHLNLRLMGDCLEIGMQNAAFGIEGFAMTISG